MKEFPSVFRQRVFISLIHPGSQLGSSSYEARKHLLPWIHPATKSLLWKVGRLSQKPPVTKIPGALPWQLKVRRDNHSPPWGRFSICLLDQKSCPVWPSWYTDVNSIPTWSAKALKATQQSWSVSRIYLSMSWQGRAYTYILLAEYG